MCFDWNRLLGIKSLFIALVCHSNSETNAVNESTIFARVPFGENTKLCRFLFLAVCFDQLTYCSFCRDICSQCIEHKILQSQRISRQYPFGGMIGPGNSVNLHNFFYRIEILRVHASFHEAYGFLMRWLHVFICTLQCPPFSICKFFAFLNWTFYGCFILVGV